MALRPDLAEMNRARAKPLFERCIPEPNTGCWLWEGSVWRGGYGSVWNGHGGVIGAHRRAWEIAKGPIPAGMLVLHKCDVPLCINPDHLFLGAQVDNMADMTVKGRAPDTAGERNGRAKLSVENVIDVRARHARGETASALARDFGVTRTAISDVVSKKRWRHI